MTSNISLWASKEYCIDLTDTGNFQTKTLNGFQRLARYLFGCYRETHLSTIRSIAKGKIFRQDFNLTGNNYSKLLSLFKKSYKQRNGWAPDPLYSQNVIFNNNQSMVKFSVYFDVSWKLEAQNQNQRIILNLGQKQDSNSLTIEDFLYSNSISAIQIKNHPLAISLGGIVKHILGNSPRVSKIKGETTFQDILSKNNSEMILDNEIPISFDFMASSEKI